MADYVDSEASTSKSKPPAAKRWVFTLNNWTEDEEEVLRNFIVDDESDYAIWGSEVADSGTPHLQGFFHLRTPKRLTALKKISARAAFFKARGNDTDNKTYCEKDGCVVFEWGEPRLGGVKATKVGQKMLQITKMLSEDKLDEVMDDVELYAVYIRYTRSLTESANKLKFQKHRKDARKATNKMTLKPWQRDITRLLRTPPDDRKIYWILDKDGNAGKTWMGSYLESRGAKCFENGKTADIAYAYNGETPVVFDLVRSIEGHMNYHALEMIKNGRMFSPKYESVSKTFPRPEVIVFANWEPDYDKLSADRWSVHEIIDGECFHNPPVKIKKEVNDMEYETIQID